MPEQEKDKQLDDLLESLLSTYSSENPRPGMETRILATVSAQKAEKDRRKLLFRWIVGVAAAAATASAVTLIAVSLTRSMSLPEPPSTIATAPVLPPIPRPVTRPLPIRQHEI